jgi:hypothetical protein
MPDPIVRDGGDFLENRNSENRVLSLSVEGRTFAYFRKRKLEEAAGKREQRNED